MHRLNPTESNPTRRDQSVRLSSVAKKLFLGGLGAGSANPAHNAINGRLKLPPPNLRSKSPPPSLPPRSKPPAPKGQPPKLRSRAPPPKLPPRSTSRAPTSNLQLRQEVRPPRRPAPRASRIVKARTPGRALHYVASGVDSREPGPIPVVVQASFRTTSGAQSTSGGLTPPWLLEPAPAASTPGNRATFESRESLRSLRDLSSSQGSHSSRPTIGGWADGEDLSDSSDEDGPAAQLLGAIAGESSQGPKSFKAPAATAHASEAKDVIRPVQGRVASAGNKDVPFRKSASFRALAAAGRAESQSRRQLVAKSAVATEESAMTAVPKEGWTGKYDLSEFGVKSVSSRSSLVPTGQRSSRLVAMTSRAASSLKVPVQPPVTPAASPAPMQTSAQVCFMPHAHHTQHPAPNTPPGNVERVEALRKNEARPGS